MYYISSLTHNFSLLPNNNLGKLISGPSDVGGTCPSGTKLQNENGVNYCCCPFTLIYCCWYKCRVHDPPKDCIAGVNGSNWVWNPKEHFFQLRLTQGTFEMEPYDDYFLRHYYLLLLTILK